MVNNNLVGGFNHGEKYEFVNGKDDNPYMKWKIIQPCLKPPASINLVTKNRCMMSYTTWILLEVLCRCFGDQRNWRLTCSMKRLSKPWRDGRVKPSGFFPKFTVTTATKTPGFINVALYIHQLLGIMPIGWVCPKMRCIIIYSTSNCHLNGTLIFKIIPSHQMPFLT